MKRKNKHSEGIFLINSGHAQTQRERNHYRLIGLPNMILRSPEKTKARGEAMVETLKLIEAQLTEWEDKQAPEFLQLLPWWEDRKKYREQKKLGNVPKVQWWEALAFLERAWPQTLAKLGRWGIDPNETGAAQKARQQRRKLPKEL